MKITSLEERIYRVPLEPPFGASWDPVPRRTFSETIVVVTTDDGIRGCCGGAQAPDLDLLERHLVGVDATDADKVWNICASVDFHGGRNWTVEVAVWDLIAKAADLPLWQLLGGESDTYKVYQSTGERIGAEERAERLIASKKAGVTAAKIRFHAADWRSDLPVVEKAREAVGPDFDLMVDANQGWRMPGDTTPPWDLTTAADCARALADLGVFWLEEPLDTVNLDGYRRLRELDLLPIAAGEMVRDLSASRQLVEHVDVIQNDVVLAGGVHGCRDVAGWAREQGRIWSPHTWSTGYGLLANLHVALAWSNGAYLEFPYDPPAWTYARRDFMLSEPLEMNSGFVTAPSGAGLGMEPDFEGLEKWRVG
ncbi:MAG: mandelate racemase/muconate lactonizing enzyme family protein [Actinobacteria bacterium]|nr:mandelate racemase/muconate lactonizing enzyme family protein [Actinomycetota bacterium]